MISKKLMGKIRHGNIRTKMAAWRFESGKNSMTKQVLEMGMRVVIVGRDGKAYEKEEWNRSGIFWQGEQENLLVADKQTIRYQFGNERERRYLRHFAWWDKLEPHQETTSRRLPDEWPLLPVPYKGGDPFPDEGLQPADFRP